MAAGLEVRRQFWLLIGTGAFAGDAAEAVGIDSKTGESWFRKAGGMPQISLDPPSTRHLCLAEREHILAGIHAGDSIRAIARRLGRAPSTILRELRANMFHQQYRSRRSLDPHAPWKYSPSRAQGKGERARARPKVAKLADNTRLHDQVQAWLVQKYSPEQISHRLRCDFAQDPEMWVSHETIYQSLYVQGRGALRRDLTVCLRTGRTLRRPRRRVGEGTAPGLVDTRGWWFSGRVCGRVDLLKLDGGESAEASLPAASVVAGLDPGDDREAEFLAGVPPFDVQDILL